MSAGSASSPRTVHAVAAVSQPPTRVLPFRGTVFRDCLQPLKQRSVFRIPGWLVWCGAPCQTPDGKFHLLFSRWPKSIGHDGWVSHSQIAYATADDVLGPYQFVSIALPGAGKDAWDADVTHNPTVIEFEGKFYLYYMGNHGNGEYWNHRNHQRVGVAVADHPAGPWKRFDRPILDVTPGAWDCLMVSNPSVTQGPDGCFCMLYKGVGAGQMPKGGAVNCGVAFANHPLGPFTKHPTPVITNPENDWAVEDPFLWCEDGEYRCLIKDFQGYFAKSEKNVLVLFHSQDGIHWQPSEDPLALTRRLQWESGVVQTVDALERPQLWFKNKRPAGLVLACAFDSDRSDSASIQLLLEPHKAV